MFKKGNKSKFYLIFFFIECGKYESSAYIWVYIYLEPHAKVCEISFHCYILYIFTIAICRKAQDSLSPRNTSSQKSSRSSRSPGRKASSARNSSRNEDNLLLGSESSDNGQNKRRQSSEAEVKGLDRVIAPDHL